MSPTSGKRSSPSVVFAGGGTGGHLFAGLAIAEHVARREPDARLLFVGAGKPWEARAVRGAGHCYQSLTCCPWPSRPSGLGRFLLANGRGFLAARRVLERACASVVVGLGGHASAPAARAAVHLGVPLLLIEPNALPGRVTRWLCRRSAAVCVASVPASKHLGGANVVITGAPVRETFRAMPAPSPEPRRAPTLFITGGSLGASALNDAVPDALRSMLPLLRSWQIVHQTGAAGEQTTRRRYAGLGISATVATFFDPPMALGENDLAICRAGALTLAELAVTGTPAIVVPYPRASDDHQRRNASVYAAAGACICLEQTTLAETLPAAVRQLLCDAARRKAMSQRMHALARPGAAADIAEMVCHAAAAQHASPRYKTSRK